MGHQNYSKVVITTKDLTQNRALLLLVKPLQDFATIIVELFDKRVAGAPVRLVPPWQKGEPRG